jgi:hypothetical protein
MRRTHTVLVVVTLCTAAGLAAAQQMTQDAQRALSRTTAATAQLDRQLACMHDKRDRLARFAQLIREADAQARTQSGRAHDDAVASITSLERQAADVDRQARQCVGNEPSAFPATVTVAPVVQVPAGRDAVVDAVAQPTNDIHQVEPGGSALSEYVHIVRGEQVDGMGRVDDGAMRSAVRAIGGRLAACYDRFVDRGALRSGQMALVFQVDGAGGVSHVAVEGDSLGDSSLHRCVQDAGRALRVSQGAHGGSATFSYALRFGTE